MHVTHVGSFEDLVDKHFLYLMPDGVVSEQETLYLHGFGQLENVVCKKLLVPEPVGYDFQGVAGGWHKCGSHRQHPGQRLEFLAYQRRGIGHEYSIAGR